MLEVMISMNLMTVYMLKLQSIIARIASDHMVLTPQRCSDHRKVAAPKHPQ